MVYTGFVSVGSSSILIPGSRTCFLKLFTWPVVLDADYIYIYTHTPFQRPWGVVLKIKKNNHRKEELQIFSGFFGKTTYLRQPTWVMK